MTRNELREYMYNPEMVQKEILDMIVNASKENITITNAMSPFNLILETIAVNSANAALESISHIRKLYPSLALTIDDLMTHVSDDEIDGMVSKPSDATFNFFINLTDLESNGYKPENTNYIETTIPEKTFINIQDVYFTLLNDIVIKYYPESNSVFVEHLQNNNVNSIKDQGILPSGIVTTSDGHRYIFFSCRIKQLKLITKTFNPIAAEGFDHTLNISQDYKFYHLDVKYKNNKTNNKFVSLPVKYNESYINPLVQSAYVKFTDNINTNGFKDLFSLRVKIPDIYFIEHDLSGTILVEMYETMGGISLALDKISLADYKVTLGDTSKNHSTATIPDINFYVGSNSTVANGSSGLSFEEIKENIINNAKGNINLPITVHQLDYDNKIDGFEIFKITDTVTERTFISAKNLDKTPQQFIKALQDVYFNTVSFTLENYLHNDSVTIFEESILIKSNSIFKNKNGVISLISQEEKDNLNKMSDFVKVEHFKTNKYFFNPFYYYISREENITNSKVYSFDNPVLENLVINSVNQNIEYKTNIDDYYISKTDEGYKILLRILKNDEMNDIANEDLKVIIAIPLLTKNKLFIKGVYNEQTDLYEFDIISRMYLDKEDNIRIENGEATTYYNLTPLKNKLDVYIYTTDPTVEDPYNYLKEDLKFVTEDFVVLAYETFNIELGRRIDYIWNKLYINYTERRYKKYQEDVLGVYEQNVYEKDIYTGFEFTPYKDGSEFGIEYNKLHSKGDPILDNKGEQVILHHKGDIMLDKNNMPIIDDIGGMIRYIDICMLDYEFKVSNYIVYQTYNNMAIKQLEAYLFDILPRKNKKLLEHTTLYYKSYKSSLPILVKINDAYFSINSSISPYIKITYNQGDKIKLNSNDLDNMETIVGGIIDKYLENSVIKLEALRNEIKAALGENVIAVQITNIEPTNSEVITFKDKSKRLSMKKKLHLTDWNQLIVKYDLTLNVETY